MQSEAATSGTPEASPGARPARQARPSRLQVVGGGAAICGALLAVAGNALVLGATPNAPEHTVSYPLSAHDFRLGQIFFACTQALMAVGIAALVRSGVAGSARWATVGGWLALVGFTVTVPGELALALVADAGTDSGRVSAASSVFGVGVVCADIGLILFGAAALRARVWPRDWAALPLLLGVFQLLVVTPVAFSAGFASAAAFSVIAAQDLLIALLGLRLVRSGGGAGATRPHSSTAAATQTRVRGRRAA